MKFINFLILTGLIALTRLSDVKQLINVDLEHFQLDENFIDIIIVLWVSGSSDWAQDETISINLRTS